MNPKSRRNKRTSHEVSATNARNFRTFLLMQQFAAAEIGARIAQARKEAGGMTQEQLAELLNVSTRSVQLYEAGEVIPWKHFQLLGTIFKRPLGWFLHGDENENRDEVMDRLDSLQAQVAELHGLLAQAVGGVVPPEEEEPAL